MTSRLFRICLMSALAITVGAVGYFGYRQWIFGKQFVSTDGSNYQQKSSRVEARGLQYLGVKDGKRVISIKVDKISVQKKKIGFLTTAISYVAMARNVVIDIFDQEDRPEQDRVTRPAGVTYENALSIETLPELDRLGVLSISAAPVSVNLFVGDAVATSVSGTSADISFKKRRILFQGDVTVKSGEKSLTADRVYFLPGSGAFKTDGKYTMKAEDVEWTGVGFVSDIFLEEVRAEK